MIKVKDIRVGDWVKTGPQQIYEIVEILDGRLIWCEDSLAEVDPKHIKEVRRDLRRRGVPAKKVTR